MIRTFCPCIEPVDERSSTLSRWPRCRYYHQYMGVIFQRRAALTKLVWRTSAGWIFSCGAMVSTRKQRMGGQVAQHIAGADEAGIDPPAGTGVFLFHLAGRENRGQTVY